MSEGITHAFKHRERFNAPISATFSGLIHECPERFLEKIDQEFEERATPERKKVATVVNQWRGEDKQWAELFRTTTCSSYDGFVSRSLKRYNNRPVLTRLTTRLYGIGRRMDKELLSFEKLSGL